jgi:hypothetical protein
MWTSDSFTGRISQNTNNPFGMRFLKLICAFFCVESLAWSVILIHPSLLSGTGVLTRHTGTLAVIRDLVNALIYAAAFYGIDKRVPITWKLGWVALAAMILGFLNSALSSVRSVEAHPAMAEGAILIVTAVVALYWGHWWNRQKSYFAPRNRKADSPRSQGA